MGTISVHLHIGEHGDNEPLTAKTSSIEQQQSRAAGIGDDSEVVPSIVDQVAGGLTAINVELFVKDLRFNKNGNIVGHLGSRSSFTALEDDTFQCNLKGLCLIIKKGRKHGIIFSNDGNAAELDTHSLVLTLQPQDFEKVAFARNLKKDNHKENEGELTPHGNGWTNSSKIETHTQYLEPQELGVSDCVAEILVEQESSVMNMQFET